MRRYCFLSEALAVSICDICVRIDVFQSKYCTYHHLHTYTTIDGVHEDIELVCHAISTYLRNTEPSRHTEATDGTTDRLPKRQEQANRGEGFLATAERARILLLRLSGHLIIGLHLRKPAKSENAIESIEHTYLQVQCTLDVIEQNFAVVTTDGEMVLEVDLAA